MCCWHVLLWHWVVSFTEWTVLVRSLTHAYIGLLIANDWGGIIINLRCKQWLYYKVPSQWWYTIQQLFLFKERCVDPLYQLSFCSWLECCERYYIGYYIHCIELVLIKMWHTNISIRSDRPEKLILEKGKGHLHTKNARMPNNLTLSGAALVGPFQTYPKMD